MELREGYTQTDVGIIPEDWNVTALSKLTTLMTNGFVGIATKHYTEADDGILYIQGYNVEENSFNFNGIKRVTKEFHKKHSKSCLQEGDLLTVQTGDVGLTTIVPKELVGSNCHALIISRFKKLIADSRFFSFYLNSCQGRTRLKEIEIGSTMKHINVGDLIHFLVPEPPSKIEQAAIANALSDADALIQSLQKIIEKKCQIKQGAMQTLLNPYEEGVLKPGWTVKKLGDVADVIMGQSPAGNTYNRNGAGVPLINGPTEFTDISPIKVQWTTEPTKFCKRDDLLICVRGSSTGRMNLSDDEYCIGRGIAAIRAKSASNTVYLTNQINLGIEELLSLSAGSTFPNIDGKSIRSIEIPLPPTLSDQNNIATILSDMDAEIVALETKLAKYQQIKQGMMQNLLTGRIRLV